MAISVDGYGNITQGNAKEIYVAWKRGDVELSQIQQKKCESFLSPEDMDEVQYDSGVVQNRGKNSIDTSDTKDKGNVTEASSMGASAAASAATVGATIMSINAGIKAGEEASNITGFAALAAALVVAVAGSITALALALGFDNQLTDRKNHSDNASNDNQTLDGYSDNLTNTMDMMNEDVQTYNEQQANLTKTVNTQTSQQADLQMQYDSAIAMGDKQGAQRIKEQMLALSKQDNSALEDELSETSSAIDDYRSMNSEAMGSAESGQTVSDFLKDGKAKGTMAIISGALCAIGAISAGIAAAKSAIPKLPFGLDAPSGLVAAALWGGLALVMGTSSGIYFKKASQENECGSNGDEMQDHINNLNDLIEQQDQYTTDTEGAFEESDTAAAESKSEASEKAGESVAGNKETLGNKPQGQGNGDKEDKPTSVVI